MEPAADAPTPEGVASPAFVTVVGLVLVAAGVALAGIRYAGGSEAEDGLEGLLGAVALGAPVMATGLLALLALDGRPALLLPAALVLVPLSFVSFALVTLPLLVPAGALYVAYRRRSGPGGPDALRAGLAVVVVAVLLVAAFLALWATEDPRTYATATTAGGTSDVITYGEALASLALTALAVASGHRLAAPRPRRR